MILAGSIFEAAHNLENTGTKFAIVTLVTTRGYAPQDVGAKALVSLDGLRFGTIGGGKIEAKAIERIKELLGRCSEYFFESIRWNLQRDVGMSCGGEVELIIEVFCPSSWNVVIFGAGHVAQALIRVLLPMRVQITCVDPRPEWTELLPKAPNLKVVVTDQFEIKEGSFVVVTTKGHATDFPVLLEAMKVENLGYLGCIGSEVKSIRLRKELREAGVAKNRIDQLKCPMGLVIGDNSPQAIAISIAAELLKVKNDEQA